MAVPLNIDFTSAITVAEEAWSAEAPRRIGVATKARQATGTALFTSPDGETASSVIDIACTIAGQGEDGLKVGRHFLAQEP